MGHQIQHNMKLMLSRLFNQTSVTRSNPYYAQNLVSFGSKYVVEFVSVFTKNFVSTNSYLNVCGSMSCVVGEDDLSKYTEIIVSTPHLHALRGVEGTHNGPSRVYVGQIKRFLHG